MFELDIKVKNKYIVSVSYEFSELLIRAFNGYDNFIKDIKNKDKFIPIGINLGYRELLEENSAYHEYNFYYDEEVDKYFFELQYQEQDLREELSKQLLLELIKINLPAGAELIVVD
ncbi:TPA: hypothetical protein ACMWHA_002025 [Clostridioides difficile]